MPISRFNSASGQDRILPTSPKNPGKSSPFNSRVQLLAQKHLSAKEAWGTASAQSSPIYDLGTEVSLAKKTSNFFSRFFRKQQPDEPVVKMIMNPIYDLGNEVDPNYDLATGDVNTYDEISQDSEGDLEPISVNTPPLYQKLVPDYVELLSLPKHTYDQVSRTSEETRSIDSESLYLSPSPSYIEILPPETERFDVPRFESNHF